MFAISVNRPLRRNLLTGQLVVARGQSCALGASEWKGAAWGWARVSTTSCPRGNSPKWEVDVATVNKKIAMEIIANRGRYADDPLVHQVVKYQNAWGGESWAILYEQDCLNNRYAPSEYVRSPEVVWSLE